MASHRGSLGRDILVVQVALLQGSEIQQGASNTDSRQTGGCPPQYSTHNDTSCGIQARLVQLQSLAPLGGLPGLGQELHPWQTSTPCLTQQQSRGQSTASYYRNSS